MNTAIKSHWRLAWRTFVKAVRVTVQTIAVVARAKYYSVRFAEKLAEGKRQRAAAEQEMLMDNGVWVMVDGKIKKEF